MTEQKKVIPPKPTNLPGSWIRDKDGTLKPNLKCPAMKAREEARIKAEAEAKAKSAQPARAAEPAKTDKEEVKTDAKG
jgi:hypothetical protein